VFSEKRDFKDRGQDLPVKSRIKKRDAKIARRSQRKAMINIVILCLFIKTLHLFFV